RDQNLGGRECDFEGRRRGQKRDHRRHHHCRRRRHHGGPLQHLRPGRRCPHPPFLTWSFATPIPTRAMIRRARPSVSTATSTFHWSSHSSPGPEPRDSLLCYGRSTGGWPSSSASAPSSASVCGLSD